MRTLGQAIRTARLARNWSQDTLAEAMHCHASLISRWETDAIEPDLSQLARLASVLDSDELRSILHARLMRQTFEILALAGAA